MTKAHIFIVSDSIGDTADRFAKAGLIQFSGLEFVTKKFSYINDYNAIDSLIKLAASENAVIVYTLIKKEICKYFEMRAKEYGIVTHDVFGGFIEKIEQKFQKPAKFELGLMHKLDAEYFDKIAAIDFAVKYDDGRDPSGIVNADIVLIGVSRTSKTPLSQFLAHKGYRVVNVPIVPEATPPKELFQIDPNKCIGLITSLEKLNTIRKERLKSLGLDKLARYSDPERIKEELHYFFKLVNKLGCKVVDVSNRAIEETAHEIEKIMKLQ